MIEFEAWPKIPRLFRPVTITEKIDGTNACVIVQQFDMGHHANERVPSDAILTFGKELDDAGLPIYEYLVAAQSRKHLITPMIDNYGFAAWVWQNAEYLANELGPGRHFGEWWGHGINRGYGQKEKRFSLFNARRWHGTEFAHPQLDLVPVIYHKRDYSEPLVRIALHGLRTKGSLAAPGYDKPEGVVVFHEDANQCFKVTIEADTKPKSVACQAPAMAA